MLRSSLTDHYSSWPIVSTPFFGVFCAAGLAYLVYEISQKSTPPASHDIPSIVFPIIPTSRLANIPPYSLWYPGIDFGWSGRRERYKKSEIVSVSGILRGNACLWTSSPEVIRQVMANKAPFSKPYVAKATVAIMGTNVVASDGDEWKQHRKIAAPAFGNEGYRQVWNETVRTFQEMSASEDWDTRSTVAISELNQYTRKLALFIVASCGFNIPLSWENTDFEEDGQLSLLGILSNVANSIILRWLAPKWLYYLPQTSKRLQRVDEAYSRLDSFLRKQIDARKSEIRSEIDTGTDPVEAKRDLFSRLVASSVGEGKSGLSDQEIIGNTFVFMFAGHETTAHSLAVTLVLLALYEDEQARVYKHIKDVIGDRAPMFEDYEALEPVVLSAVYESMRLYPAVYLSMRQADKDTVINVPKPDGSGSTEMFVPKGQQIVLDLIGAGYNSRTYPDAYEFKPSRFDGNHDSSVAFSQGPRTCLGKKFATTEMVCFLTLMLRDWEIRIERGSETREEWRERIMRPTLDVAMLMPPFPVTLVRRQS